MKCQNDVPFITSWLPNAAAGTVHNKTFTKTTRFITKIQYLSTTLSVV